MGIWGEMVFLLLWIELGDSNKNIFFTLTSVLVLSHRSFLELFTCAKV